MARSLACVLLLSTGCIVGAYSRPVPPLDTQRKDIFAGKQGSLLGKVDADLRPYSKKSSTAATASFWVQFRGAVGDKLCFLHAVESSGSKSQVMDQSDRYLKKLRKAMLVVQAHDSLEVGTRWEKRSASDLRSAVRIGENITRKYSRSLKNPDGSPKVYYDGTMQYELCTVTPTITPTTRYFTLRMAPNSDGQQLFVWEIEQRERDNRAPEKPASDAPTERSTLLVTAALEASGSFKTLVGAIVDTDLDVELDGAGPFTILAPTDEAFAAWPEKRRAKLFGNKDKLAKYLRRYILVGALPPSAEVVKLDARTLGDKTLPVATTPDGLRFSGTELGKPIAAANGLIYKLDEAPAP